MLRCRKKIDNLVMQSKIPAVTLYQSRFTIMRLKPQPDCGS
jgi:hypothetical protein